jgi:hypothetical protein
MKYCMIILFAALGCYFYFAPGEIKKINHLSSIKNTSLPFDGRALHIDSTPIARAPSSTDSTLTEDDYTISKGKGTDIFKNLTPEEKLAIIPTLVMEIRRDTDYAEFLRTNFSSSEKALELIKVEKKIEEKKNILDELETGSN